MPELFIAVHLVLPPYETYHLSPHVANTSVFPSPSKSPNLKLDTVMPELFIAVHLVLPPYETYHLFPHVANTSVFPSPSKSPSVVKDDTESGLAQGGLKVGGGVGEGVGGGAGEGVGGGV